MKRIELQRTILFALVLGGTAVAVACSFPDVTFSNTPITNDEGGLDGSSDASNDASTVDEEGPTDARTDVIDFPPDVVVYGDAGMLDGDAANPCDIDRDGYKAKGTVGTIECGGNDCDDNDSRANPGIKDISTAKARPTANGDWNCSGAVQKQFPEGQSCPGLALGKCAQNTGFTKVVACGEQGDYITTCTLNIATCVATTKKEIQGCL